MKTFVCNIALATLALSVSAFAQGSGSTHPPSTETSASDFKVTKSVTGIVKEVNAEENLLILEDRNGNPHNFKVNEQTKFKAAKRQKGTKQAALRLGGITAGQEVKVTFRPEDHVAVEVKGNK